MFVSNFFEHDTRVLREAEALAAAGHEVRVIAARGPGTAEREHIGNVEVVRIDADPLPARAARAAIGVVRAVRRPRARGYERAELGSVGDALGGRSVGELLLRTHLPLTHRLFRRRAVEEASSRPADVWLAHDLDTLEAAATARRRHGGRLVYDSHELWLERAFAPPLSVRAKRRWAAVEARLIREADVRITVSDLLADELARRYLIDRPAVIRNLPSRADRSGEGRSGLRASLGLPGGAPVVIYVGGLAADRGLEELVRSAPGVDGLQVVVLGPGRERYAAGLDRLAAEVGAEGRLHLLPAVPPDRVVAEVAGADVGLVANLHPGLNHRYTVPNRLYTCLAAGVPVVANHSPAFEPIIRTHELGTTCDVRDPEELAAAIRWVLDPQRHERLRANALAYSERESWEREAERFVGLLEGKS